MPAPVVNVKSSGVQRPSTAPANGPADEFGSQTTINPAGIVSQIRNNTTIIQKVLGDGRVTVPVLSSTPSGLAPGQLYLQDIAGTVYLVYVDNASTPIQVTNGSPAPTVPTVYPLTIAVPELLDSLLVDTAGCAYWFVSVSDITTGRRAIYQIAVTNNGTTGADATSTSICVTGGSSIGTPDVGSQITWTTTFTGAGASQYMNLFITSSVAGLQAAIVRSPLIST